MRFVLFIIIFMCCLYSQDTCPYPIDAQCNNGLATKGTKEELLYVMRNLCINNTDCYVIESWLPIIWDDFLEQAEVVYEQEYYIRMKNAREYAAAMGYSQGSAQYERVMNDTLALLSHIRLDLQSWANDIYRALLSEYSDMQATGECLMPAYELSNQGHFFRNDSLFQSFSINNVGEACGEPQFKVLAVEFNYSIEEWVVRDSGFFDAIPPGYFYDSVWASIPATIPVTSITVDIVYHEYQTWSYDYNGEIIKIKVPVLASPFNGKTEFYDVLGRRTDKKKWKIVIPHKKRQRP
ncbi:hypothetical protein ACFL5V_05765 [Fibrobacterota bacterium]